MNNFSQKTVQVPTSACRFAAQSSATPVEGTNRFSLVPFAGQVFDHGWWGKMTFDIEGISLRKNVIPAFANHDPAQFVGEIDSIEKKDGKVVLSGEFAATPAAEVIKAVKKLDWECSLAFDMSSAVIEEVGADAAVMVNGAQFSAGTVIRKAVLYETSFTFFGAVPGTQTSFGDDKNSGSVSVNIFFKEGEGFMSDDLKKVQEDAKAAALGLFQKMSAMCGDDKSFAADCFAKGMDLEQFQSALIERQNEQVAKLKAEVVAASKSVIPTGAAPVAFTAAPEAKAEEKLTFTLAAHKLAKEEKISLASAFSRIANENPALYQAHVDAAPVVKSKR